jgi:hypothetical protein
LRFGEKGGGGKHFFSRTKDFFYRERGKELFWDLEKIKGPKEKKRIKGENNKKCISITITGLLLKR